MSNEDEQLPVIRSKKEEMLKKIIAMPGEVVHIKSVDHFNELVNKYKDIPIVIDMWADWCGPCKIFSPIFEAAQKEWGTEFVFAKLNTEEHPAVATTLNVVGIPLMLFILDKQEIHRQSGALRKGQFYKLLQAIKDAVNKKGPSTTDASGMYS